MPEHAFLPPSSADVWAICAMWPTMNARFPELEPEQASLDGQAVHWAIADAVVGATPKLGTVSPMGPVLDDEMLDGVDSFMTAIQPLMTQELHVEERIYGTVIHDSLNWGTPDLWTFKAPYLDIFDYKHGHEFVEVYENHQLLNYAALILEKLGIRGGHDEHVTVRMHVVQPRSYTPDGPHRTWTVLAADLRGYFNRLRHAADEATGKEPLARVNPGCKHCPGRHACTMLQRVAQSAADQSGHVMPVELPPEAVGIELRMLQRAQKMLSARITGLEEQAESLLRSGKSVPHFMLETRAARETWGKPIEEIIAVGQLLGFNLGKPGICTPAQARKAGLSADIVAAYQAPRGNSLTLVPSDDSKARKVFG